MTTILLSSISFVHAQDGKIDKFPRSLYWGGFSNEDFFNQSDYIFEGKIINTITYPNEDTTKLWTSFLIEIIYVLKGNDEIQKGQIEIIKKSGILTFPIKTIFVDDFEVNDEFIFEYKDDIAFTTPKHGIFFCKKTDLSFRPATNNPSVEIFENMRNAGLTYMPNLPSRSFELFGLNDLYLKDMDALYDYARQFQGISVPEQQKKSGNSTE